MDHRRLRARLEAHRSGQTGLAQVAEAAVDGAAWATRVAQLRQLIQQRRQRMTPPVTAASARMPSVVAAAAPSTPGAACSAGVPGLEVAPGVRLVEEAVSELPAPQQPGELRCFDTETTGLRGGAGLWVWMIGLLCWRGSERGWVLRQWWLERPSAERSYLQCALADLEPASARLVSFNGKSYDLPHLTTRLMLNGLSPSWDGRPHLDLLHGLRRQRPSDWPDCRLRTAEERLLGLHRHDDLPGAEAPRCWRSFLRDGASAGIRQVLAHNRQDLLSLARLLPHVPMSG